MNYQVVYHQSKQYSIWPENKVIPKGWASTGFSGSETQCLDTICDAYGKIFPKRINEDHQN
ncbi:MbtH-like protein [Vibrio ruber DSM 16370]|uniref:MbtH-like protein n=1 Tax=Vibrio ruber (strain DSM 16370 / JCM 11486 / BCRC 17186 / CECT 7878 / LMG 23124 / VR1) TaxID=1123498 RepID=A0A1R4LAV8_VIBR1|nr:MbtH family NRPS accessory protein [Vibrio ruber]SJN53701.1 MbtH-like protein [Vibrio ruber DSM 16370]